MKPPESRSHILATLAESSPGRQANTPPGMLSLNKSTWTGLSGQPGRIPAGLSGTSKACSHWMQSSMSAWTSCTGGPWA